MSWEWISKSFDLLPRSNDPFFRLLWAEKRLALTDTSKKPDGLDELTASVMCAALDRRQSLFLTLPDSDSRRPALLFATCLIMSALDQLAEAENEKMSGTQTDSMAETYTVLYFGSTIGIREQLGYVSVDGGIKLNLAEVFRSDTTKRGQVAATPIRPRRKSRRPAESDGLSLPHVLCIYAPADPVALLEAHKPKWIAIDCGDAPHLRWLPLVMAFAAERHLPVIAWGQNPLSECIAEFKPYGNVFTIATPPCRPVPSRRLIRSNPKLVFESPVVTHALINVMHGELTEELSESLRTAEVSLLQCSRSVMTFSQDAARVHWRLLRAIEQLSVPYAFYEAEVGRHYGLSSFQALRDACLRFRTLLESTDHNCYNFLDQSSDAMDFALKLLEGHDPPLWSQLTTICEAPTDDNLRRVLVFSTRARKKLFILALLAQKNLTVEDLEARHIRVVDLYDLRGNSEEEFMSNEPNIRVSSFESELQFHVVGLPSAAATARLLPLLLNEHLSVYVCPHQSLTAQRRVAQWNSALKPNVSTLAAILQSLNNDPYTIQDEDIPERVAGYVSQSKIGQEPKRTRPTRTDGLIRIGDQTEELTRLFEVAVTDKYDEPSVDDAIVNDDLEEAADPLDNIWSDRAVSVDFEHGWHVNFHPDDIINVIVSSATGQQIQERYVRSLTTGDRVVLVHGQRRQSLYDLIISRVHKHPSIELHLALIRRWHQDVVSGFTSWRQHGVKNLETLLALMRRNGSTITSSLTLRAWLTGVTLCPLDDRDLLRIADILDLTFVCRHHKDISRAANRIRGIHRGTAHRLNRWLEEQAQGLTTAIDNQVIDPTLGLTFGDLRNSLMLLRVESVMTLHGAFLTSNLGTVERYANVS